MDGALVNRKSLIIDRDAKYWNRSREFVEEGGTEVIRLQRLAPSLNAFAERFVRSIQEKCLGRMIPFGQASLGRATAEYMVHFHEDHEEQNHLGLENRLISRSAEVAAHDLVNHRRVRLGGVLSDDHRAAG